MVDFDINLSNLGINPVMKVGHDCGKVGDEPGAPLFIQPWTGCSGNSQHVGRENLLMEHFRFLKLKP